MLVFLNSHLVCTNIIDEGIAIDLEKKTEMLSKDIVNKGAQNINDFSLSRQGCNEIISFLKDKKTNRTIGAKILTGLQKTLKDGFFLYSSVLTGLGALYYFAKDQKHIGVTAAIVSGVSMISFYVLIKVIESTCLDSKSKDEFIDEIIYQVREISDFVE
jgi:hypothetical protein